jgi:hypothetical protein
MEMNEMLQEKNQVKNLIKYFLIGFRKYQS